jgi:hypothetical protein
MSNVRKSCLQEGDETTHTWASTLDCKQSEQTDI